MARGYAKELGTRLTRLGQMDDSYRVGTLAIADEAPQRVIGDRRGACFARHQRDETAATDKYDVGAGRGYDSLGASPPIRAAAYIARARRRCVAWSTIAAG